ncbi:hypothetical protein [Arthrobacter gengyunqii]|uniref:Uncharacterized protein n=1 Tax=Arthrobacter gengyunqii TaxID=2886940 RepID=A0ABS8GH42_9MICC|nr:hypothetical protein [Arthrobacter gengyunqii]MCC3265894.1 hypothetical protein [Arthrobacter gengyunqii]
MTTEEHPCMPNPGALRQSAGGPNVSPFTLGTPVKLYDRTDGTYLHPAPSATAEHCINFWANVQIPDEIITQVENAYYYDRQQEINDDMEDTMREWTVQWMEANPEPPKKAGPAATEQYNQRFRDEHEVQRQAILPEVESKRPVRLYAYDTPQIIRAAQMARHHPDKIKFPDEFDRVMTYPIELLDGEYQLHEINKKYRPSRILPYITAVVKDDNEALMLEAIGQTNELLSAWQYERSEDRIVAQERDQY